MFELIISFLQKITVEWWAIIASISLGVFNFWQSNYQRKKAEDEKIDKKLFKKITAQMSYIVANNLSYSLEQNILKTEEVETINKTIKILEDKNHKFNNKKREKSKLEVLKSLIKLQSFLTKHFFLHSGLLTLYPEFKYSKNTEHTSLYKEKSKELENNLQDFNKAIKQFFKDCKKIYI